MNKLPRIFIASFLALVLALPSPACALRPHSDLAGVEESLAGVEERRADSKLSGYPDPVSFLNGLTVVRSRLEWEDIKEHLMQTPRALSVRVVDTRRQSGLLADLDIPRKPDEPALNELLSQLSSSQEYAILQGRGKTWILAQAVLLREAPRRDVRRWRVLLRNIAQTRPEQRSAALLEIRNHLRVWADGIDIRVLGNEQNGSIALMFVPDAGRLKSINASLPARYQRQVIRLLPVVDEQGELWVHFKQLRPGVVFRMAKWDPTRLSMDALETLSQQELRTIPEVVAPQAFPRIEENRNYPLSRIPLLTQLPPQTIRRLNQRGFLYLNQEGSVPGWEVSILAEFSKRLNRAEYTISALKDALGVSYTTVRDLVFAEKMKANVIHRPGEQERLDRGEALELVLVARLRGKLRNEVGGFVTSRRFRAEMRISSQQFDRWAGEKSSAPWYSGYPLWVTLDGGRFITGKGYAGLKQEIQAASNRIGRGRVLLYQAVQDRFRDQPSGKMYGYQKQALRAVFELGLWHQETPHPLEAVWKLFAVRQLDLPVIWREMESPRPVKVSQIRSDRLYSVETAARVIGRPAGTVRNLIGTEKRIPSSQLSGMNWVRGSDLLSFMGVSAAGVEEEPQPIGADTDLGPGTLLIPKDGNFQLSQVLVSQGQYGQNPSFITVRNLGNQMGFFYQNIKKRDELIAGYLHLPSAPAVSKEKTEVVLLTKSNAEAGIIVVPNPNDLPGLRAIVVSRKGRGNHAVVFLQPVDGTHRPIAGSQSQRYFISTLIERRAQVLTTTDPVLLETAARRSDETASLAGLEELDLPELPGNFPYQVVSLATVPDFWLSLTDSEIQEFERRLLYKKPADKSEQGQHYLVKWETPSEQTAWPEKDDPAREYLFSHLARQLGGDVTDVVIPDSDERRRLAEFYGVANPDDIYLVELSEDYSPEDREAVLELDPDAAFTRDFGIAVLLRMYDFREKNFGPIRGSSTRMMFDGDQAFNPKAANIGTFALALAINYWDQPAPGPDDLFELDPNRLLGRLHLDELQRLVKTVHDFQEQRLQEIVDQAPPHLQSRMRKLIRPLHAWLQSYRSDLIRLLELFAADSPESQDTFWHPTSVSLVLPRGSSLAITTDQVRQALALSGLEEPGQERVARLLEAAAGRSADQPFQICFLCNQNLERSPALELLLKDFLQKQAIQGFRVESAAVLPWIRGEEIQTDQENYIEALSSQAQSAGIPMPLIRELADKKPRAASQELLEGSGLILVTSHYHPNHLRTKLKETLSDDQVQKIMDRVVTFQDLLGPKHQSLTRAGNLRVIPDGANYAGFLQQMDDALDPLFEQLTALRGGLEEPPLSPILTPEFRNQVRRIIWMDHSQGLSQPVLNLMELFPSIWTTFPQAELVLDVDTAAPLVRAPEGRTLIRRDFKDARSLPDEILVPDTLVITTGYVDDALKEARNGSLLVLDNFGWDTTYGKTNIRFEKRGKNSAVQISDPGQWRTQDRQRSILKKLGFQISLETPSSFLTEEQFSDELQEEIRRWRRRLVESGATRSKPLLVVNPFKSMNGYWTYGTFIHENAKEAWFSLLEKIVLESDVAVVLNPGPFSWKKLDEPYSQLIDLQKYLASLPNRRAEILDLEAVGLTEAGPLTLAAILFLAKETGGALLDVQTGTTHLADWMDVPEVLLMFPRGEFRLTLRERSRRIQVPVESFASSAAAEQKVVDALQHLLNSAGRSGLEERDRNVNEFDRILNPDQEKNERLKRALEVLHRWRRQPEGFSPAIISERLALVLDKTDPQFFYWRRALQYRMEQAEALFSENLNPEMGQPLSGELLARKIYNLLFLPFTKEEVFSSLNALSERAATSFWQPAIGIREFDPSWDASRVGQLLNGTSEAWFFGSMTEGYLSPYADLDLRFQPPDSPLGRGDGQSWYALGIPLSPEGFFGIQVLNQQRSPYLSTAPSLRIPPARIFWMRGGEMLFQGEWFAQLFLQNHEIRDGLRSMASQGNPLPEWKIARQALGIQQSRLDPAAGVEEEPRHWVAVIGAGPAGIAGAERLRALGHEVALFNEAAPYGGLAVYGVYPDKEAPMKMAYRFKSLGPAVVTPGIHYYGNVRVGKGGDLTLEQLRELGFSAVVVAVGAEGSKPLGIPGERPNLPGLYQAKDLVAFYQGDPVQKDLDSQLGKTTVWIGMGNVTVDTTHYAIHRRDYEAVERFVRMLKPEEWKEILREFKRYLPDESQLRRNLSFYRPGVGRTVDVDELREALRKAKLEKFLIPLDWAWEQTVGVESTRNAYWVARRGPDQKAFDPKELEALAPYIDLEDLREELDRVAVVMGWSILDEAAAEQRLHRLLFGHPKTGTLQGNPAEKLKQFGTRLDKARIRMRFLLRGHSIEGEHAGGLVLSENEMSGGRLIETDRIAPLGEVFRGTPIDSVILSIGNEHDAEIGLETQRGFFATREKVPAGENPSVPAHFQSAAAEDVFLAGWALFPSAGKVGETMRKGIQAVDLAVGPYLAERSDLKKTPEDLQADRAALDQVLEEIGVQKVSGGQAAALHAWFIQNGYQPNDRAEILRIAQDLEERKVAAELLTEARLPQGVRIFAQKNAIPRAVQSLFKEQGIEVVDLPNDLEEARSLLGAAGDLSNAVAWISPSVEWFERDEWNGLFAGLGLRALQLVGVMPHSVDRWSLAHWAALFGAFPKAGLQVILSVEEEDHVLSIYV
ncbi:MAG: FAD-dependent oxidoreductase [Candidatus Omnitrophota bacterium]|nr:FAD-dependent oxidoreductase [Candidatus Omnitrophota bacterium]